jgi:xanthine dehydrogenase YagS FAD-binding subunit
VAAVLDADTSDIRHALVAFGSLAPKPWRSTEAEQTLIGQVPRREIFEMAADAALNGARGYGRNDFKIALARRTLVAVLEQLVSGR